MSNPDSFIDEVTEEVRRDRLFRLFKRYGWIGALAVVVIVGGAGYREYTISRDRADAEQLGDSIFAALEQEDAAVRAESLASLDAEDISGQALIQMIAAGEMVEAGRIQEASDSLRAIASNSELPAAYRDLAILKSVTLRDSSVSPDQLIEQLEPLTGPGRPFRPLASERTAHALIEAGKTSEAVELLRGLVDDTDAPFGVRQRAYQLIDAIRNGEGN